MYCKCWHDELEHNYFDLGGKCGHMIVISSVTQISCPCNGFVKHVEQSGQMG